MQPQGQRSRPAPHGPNFALSEAASAPAVPRQRPAPAVLGQRPPPAASRKPAPNFIIRDCVSTHDLLPQYQLSVPAYDMLSVHDDSHAPRGMTHDGPSRVNRQTAGHDPPQNHGRGVQTTPIRQSRPLPLIKPHAPQPDPLPLTSHTVVTPLKAGSFGLQLRTHPDRAFAQAVVSDIQRGACIGYIGPRSTLRARNLRSATINPDVISETLHKECVAGRMAGPYDCPPCPKFRSSGVGLVPKKSGKMRMITHLSAPAGRSINDFIPKDLYSLQYTSVDDAITMIQNHGPGALMAKTDVKQAFRLIPVQPADWPLLGIQWQGQFYVDKCLPFGLRSAPFLFNRLAEAFEWILRHNYGITDILHYLDDFFTVGPPASTVCLRKLQTISSVASSLGLPLAPEKTEGPATRLTFLGIELDSMEGRAHLPPDKLSELRELIVVWRQRRKCQKRHLLSLIGKLSFATKVVPAGRVFMRRLIDASTTVTRMHHRITLTKETRADLAWWHQFLPVWPGTSLFLEEAWTPAPTLHLYTDAAGAIGYGAYFNGAWLSESWLPHQRLNSKGISIAWQELFAIVAAVWTWSKKLQRKKVIIHTDNMSITQAWARTASRDPFIMQLIRILYLLAARGSFLVKLSHIAGVNNVIADSLSRQQFTRFRNAAPHASAAPAPRPCELDLLTTVEDQLSPWAN